MEDGPPCASLACVKARIPKAHSLKRNPAISGTVIGEGPLKHVFKPQELRVERDQVRGYSWPGELAGKCDPVFLWNQRRVFAQCLFDLAVSDLVGNKRNQSPEKRSPVSDLPRKAEKRTNIAEQPLSIVGLPGQYRICAKRSGQDPMGIEWR